MKSVLTTALFSLALAFSGGALVAGEGKDAKAQSDESKQVCKRVRSTGSRVRQKVCHTERQWQRIADESRETLDKNRAGRDVNVSGGDS